jgi:hypothetical protein
MATTVTVPPIPYKSPLLDARGFLTPAWSKWFEQMFLRAGGNIALTNVELENLQSQDLAVVEADISALETLTASHTSSISTINTDINTIESSLNDLGQGPVL